MADKTVPELDPITDPQETDLVAVVDVSDTTDSPEGTSKKMSLGQYSSYGILNDVGATASGQVIDWSLYTTFNYILTANVTFVEINTPPIGKTKVISIYMTGNFVPTFPATWTFYGESYNGVGNNLIVVEWVKSGLVWAFINSETPV